MRLSRLLVLVFFVGISGSVSGQTTSAPAEIVSHDMIVSVVQGLNGKLTGDDGKYAVELKNRTFSAYRLDSGRRLLLKATVKDQPSLETVNRFNEKTSAITRAVRYEKLGVMLESAVDCQLGITEKGLQRLFTRFVADLADFETFIAQNKSADKPAADAPANVPVAERRNPPLEIEKGSDDRRFMITFPTNTANWGTAWKIDWDIETAQQAVDQGIGFRPSGRSVLFKIKKAYFKPGKDAEWIQVLEDAHPQEFYVPYYFRNTRFFDLRDVGGYTTLSPNEGGAVSQVLGKSKRVIAELRDTGTAYKFGHITRRSEELTLFANFQAGNYTYMAEFGFRDDGGIVFRHSPTGYNFFPHLDATHMHGSYWRIGMKLGPDGNNTTNQVFVTRLPTDPKDQAEQGKMNIQEITSESFVDWKAEEFTRIRVVNPNYAIIPEAKGRPALPISYDLVTYPQGLARHDRFKDEKFSMHDFWITRFDGPEKTYVNLGNYFFPKGQLNANLLPLKKKNVVLWHSSSGLHVPRPEDGILKGNSSLNGQATIYWTTFELRPRNLFTGTPLYRINDAAAPKGGKKGPSGILR